MSLTNQQPMPCNIPEERRPQLRLHRAGTLKSSINNINSCYLHSILYVKRTHCVWVKKKKC